MFGGAESLMAFGQLRPWSRFPAESSMGSPAPSKHLSQKRKAGRFREITCSINLPQKAEF